MTVSVDVYKGTTKLGSGTGTAGSASITSFTALNTVGSGRNVQVVLTSSAATPSCVGMSFATRVLTDATTTLTLKDAIPFS